MKRNQLKINALCKKYGPAVVTGGLLLAAGPTFAADGDIDISKGLLYIGGGLVAAGALTAAMIGLVTLIGAGKKAQRAGT